MFWHCKGELSLHWTVTPLFSGYIKTEDGIGKDSKKIAYPTTRIFKLDVRFYILFLNSIHSLIENEHCLFINPLNTTADHLVFQ